MNDGGEARLSQNNVCGTTGSVGGTLDGDTDVGTEQEPRCKSEKALSSLITKVRGVGYWEIDPGWRG